MCAGELGLPMNATPEEWDAECIRRNAVHSKNSASLQISKGNVSTPYELCRVLEELVNPRIISRKNARKIIDVLKLYDPDDRILEFDSYIEIANKGGWISTVRSDMGIVFAKNPFYLVLMGKRLTNPEKNRFMNSYDKIVKLAMNYFGSPSTA